MDPRLENALTFANYNLTLEREKLQAKENFRIGRVIYRNKGQFTITVELLSYCKILIDSDNTEDVVLIDDNENPILIEDLTEFYQLILSQYSIVCNDYYERFSSLSKKRNVEDIVFND
jgi:hypothetical protein